MRAAVRPPEVLSAPVAMAKRPRMAWKPSVFESWLACFTASNRLRESDDFKPNSVRVRERKFIFAVIGKSVLLPRHMIQAPGTEPIARRIAGRERSAIDNFHMSDLRRALLNACFN